MSRKCEILSRFVSVLVIVVAHFPRVDAATTFARRHQERAIRNMLQTKSWRWLLDDKRRSDGTQQSRDFRDPPQIKDDADLDRISSAMYATLECACGRSVSRLLHANAIGTPSVSSHLTHVNVTILKIASALMDFANKAPNVAASREPGGFLTAALSLNLHVDRLIRTVNRKREIENRVEIVPLLDRMRFQMVNLIERFLIENCSMSNDDDDNDGSDATMKMEFDRINDTLDRSGLSTTAFLSDGSMAAKIESFAVTIARAIEKLRPVMTVEDRLLRMCKNPRNDVQDVFLCMEFVFDSMMEITYRKTLEELKLYDEYAQDANSDHLTSTINSIAKYELLVQRSVIARFPARFVNHVRSIMKMKRDAIVYGKVYNTEILKRKIKNYLSAIAETRKKFPGPQTTPSVSGSSKRTDLYAFLEEIILAREFVTFNGIFKLLLRRKGGHFSEKVLNGMSYYIRNDRDAEKTCDKMRNLYVHCFDAQSKIEGCRSKSNCLKDVRNKSFSILLDAVEDVNNTANFDAAYKDENLETVARLIDRYLRNNRVTNYRHHDGKPLATQLRYVANLIDKYQIHNCESPTYRRSFYASFAEQDKKRFADRLKRVQGDRKVSAQNLENEESPVDEKSYLESIIAGYVDAFADLRLPVKFYWRGEAKTIGDVSKEIAGDDRPLGFTVFANYVDAFHRWIVSVLLYAIIDVLEHFVVEKYAIDDDRSFTSYIRKLLSIDFPEQYAPVIRFIGGAENFYHARNIVEFKTFLKEHLEEQFGVFRQKTRPSTNDTFAILSERLDRIFNKLAELYNEKSHVITNIKFGIKYDKKIK